jgi:hypothetical protein
MTRDGALLGRDVAVAKERGPFQMECGESSGREGRKQGGVGREVKKEIKDGNWKFAKRSRMALVRIF